MVTQVESGLVSKGRRVQMEQEPRSPWLRQCSGVWLLMLAFLWFCLLTCRASLLAQSSGSGLAETWVSRVEGSFGNTGPAGVHLGCAHSEFGQRDP